MTNKIALWRVYIWGRKEQPRTIGYVIASVNLDWSRKAGATVCFDIVRYIDYSELVTPTTIGETS